jgi:hypothetical protein
VDEGRAFRRPLAGVEDRERPVADLPAVAVRAVVDAPAPELLEARLLGQLINDAGCEQELASSHDRPLVQDYLEVAVPTPRGGGPSGAHLDARVRSQLLSGYPE